MTERITFRRRSFLQSLAVLPFASQAMIVGEDIPKTPKILSKRTNPTISVSGAQLELRSLEINYGSEILDVSSFLDPKPMSFREYLQTMESCRVEAKWYWNQKWDQITLGIFEQSESVPIFIWLPSEKYSFEAEALLEYYNRVSEPGEVVISETRFLCTSPPTITYLDDEASRRSRRKARRGFCTATRRAETL